MQSTLRKSRAKIIISLEQYIVDGHHEKEVSSVKISDIVAVRLMAGTATEARSHAHRAAGAACASLSRPHPAGTGTLRGAEAISAREP